MKVIKYRKGIRKDNKNQLVQIVQYYSHENFLTTYKCITNINIYKYKIRLGLKYNWPAGKIASASLPKTAAYED